MIVIFLNCNLSKRCPKVLISRLKERNLVTSEIKITFYRYREQNFLKYFSEEDSIVYCSNIRSLINEIKLDIYIYIYVYIYIYIYIYIKEWRLKNGDCLSISQKKV